VPTDTDRKAVLKERERRRLLHGGLGLYTYPQIRNTTPFQLVAQIVVGLFVALMGALLFWGVWRTRIEEISNYGSANSHLGGFTLAAAVILIGVFWAHPGIIFYLRKLRTPDDRSPS
jgi:hypothetical protein